MFDFYFVQPERAKAQLEAGNPKLAETGKPPLKKASLQPDLLSARPAEPDTFGYELRKATAT